MGTITLSRGPSLSSMTLMSFICHTSRIFHLFHCRLLFQTVYSTFLLSCQVKIEVFQLVKQEVLSQGEEGEGDENEEEAGLGGILNLEQEWL